MTNVEYSSALALKLSGIFGLAPSDLTLPDTALNLAERIKHDLHQSIQLLLLNSSENPLDRIWQNFTISVNSSGWIYLELSDVGLTEWLRSLSICSIGDKSLTKVDLDPVPKHTACPGSDPSSAQVLAILFAHARCCSLLKLVPAHQAALKWPLNWLDGNPLRYCRFSAWHLIGQISDTLDYLAMSLNSQSWNQSLKVATRLGQAFELFYADHAWIERPNKRLMGSSGGPSDLSEPALPLASRLGLVDITQKVLQTLIEQRLYLTAPRQL